MLYHHMELGKLGRQFIFNLNSMAILFPSYSKAVQVF